MGKRTRYAKVGEVFKMWGGDGKRTWGLSKGKKKRVLGIGFYQVAGEVRKW